MRHLIIGDLTTEAVTQSLRRGKVTCEGPQRRARSSGPSTACPSNTPSLLAYFLPVLWLEAGSQRLLFLTLYLLGLTYTNPLHRKPQKEPAHFPRAQKEAKLLVSPNDLGSHKHVTHSTVHSKPPDPDECPFHLCEAGKESNSRRWPVLKSEGDRAQKCAGSFLGVSTSSNHRYSLEFTGHRTISM